MSYSQVILGWLEGLWSLLLSIVQDQLSGIYDDLRFTIIDSAFGHIVSNNPYLEEISEIIHGLIEVGQAFSEVADSVIYLVLGLIILKGIIILFSILGEMPFHR